MVAHVFPPPSDPANSAFLRVMAWVSRLAYLRLRGENAAQLFQRGQCRRFRRFGEQHRPAGDSNLRNVHVTHRVYSYPMGRHELTLFEAGTLAANARELQSVVGDDRNSGAEIGRVPVHAHHRTELTNVAMGALSARHEHGRGAVQIVPLGLIAAIAVKDLDPMVLPIDHIDPAIIVCPSSEHLALMAA